MVDTFMSDVAHLVKCTTEWELGAVWKRLVKLSQRGGVLSQSR